jgi:tetratricopeptide (TPR) repeat protein
MPFDIDTTKIFFEKTTQAVDWVVEEIIRQRNWRSILALLDVALFLAFNPFQWPFPNLFSLFPQLEQFRWYKPLFWTLLVAIFVAAVSVAVRVKPRTAERVDLKLSAIKGLLPFSYQDADIFERLERTQNLRECLQAISDEHWRLGVLSGESGVGKSSFLQAGLWPEIEKLKLRCVYVKFSDLDPFESVRRACLKHLAPLNPQAGGADGNVNGDGNFLNLLHAVIDLNPTPIVLLFDQFEQFFVHRKQKSDRAPFVQALARWFAKEQSLPVKILICIRGDFLDRLNELQKAMAYSLSPMQSFRLERFEPDQATEVFCFLAEKERLDHDRKFITEFMRQEMADSEDGLVSPVNIQVLAWMIVGQRLRSDRAFTRATFQKLGGVDGLLERYLTRALSARETETRRQAAIKVLLTLVDLERNARAGALTLEALRQKLRGEIRDAELKEVVSWLGRGDVRLIWSSVETDGEKFELAHERLIPALRRLAGKQLSAADRANQLLERRANEWLGNGRHSRYLFSWAELRLIKKQRRFITWGKDRQAKEDLLSASRRRFRVQFVATGLIAMLAVIGWAWWNSNQWQSYLIRRDLRDYGGRLNDSNALTEIARGFASAGERQRSLQVIERITDESVKNYALRAVAESFAIGGERAQAKRLLVEAIKNVDLVGDGYSKAQTMRAIARLIVKLGDNDGLGALLSDLGEAAKRLPDNCARASVLASLAGASANLGDTKRMGELFTEAIKIVDRTCGDSSKVDALEEIARASAEFGGPQRARAWILAAIGKTDLIIFDQNRGNALKAIAQAIPMLGDQENLNAIFSEVVEGERFTLGDGGGGE